jgi:hypothetical protein
MRQLKEPTLAFSLLLSLLVFSCNQPSTTTDKNDKDTTQVIVAADTTSIPAYDPALDPLTMAGANGKLIQDSLGIKIFEVWLKPGELAPLHSHPDHAMYVLQGGKVMLYSKDIPGFENGNPAEFKVGEGLVNGPIMDSARNIGNTTIKLLEVDVHRPRNK